MAQLKSAGVQQKYLNLAELHLSEAPDGGIFQSTGPSPSDGQPREVVSFYDLMDWPYLWPIGGWGGVYLFVLISSDFLSQGWVGRNPAADI